MTYQNFVLQAMELTISKTDEGIFYLEPEWQDIICRNVTGNLDELSDSNLSGWYDVEDMLKLEVKKRNLPAEEKKKKVIDWLYETITAVVEPAILQEETNFIQNMTEYLKVAHAEEQTADA